jgi:hypothetical protein
LGAYVADAKKLMFLGADHLIEEEGIRKLQKYDLQYMEHVYFLRNDNPQMPGIFCCHKTRYMELKGLDEIFSGHYGHEDINYRMRHQLSGGYFTLLEYNVKLRQKPHHHNLSRDKEPNQQHRKNKTHSGLFLNFDWHSVIQVRR